MFTPTEISDVLHDAVHGACEQCVVLIVHRNDDEELRPAGRVAEHLAQRESVVPEVIRIARRGRIAHMCELALVSVCAEVEQFGRHRQFVHKVAAEEPVCASDSQEEKKKKKPRTRCAGASCGSGARAARYACGRYRHDVAAH